MAMKLLSNRKDLKSESLNLRITSGDKQKLTEVAESYGLPTGTLVEALLNGVLGKMEGVEPPRKPAETPCQRKKAKRDIFEWVFGGLILK